MDKIDFSKYGLNPVSESTPDFKSYGLTPASEQLIEKAQQQGEQPVEETDPVQQFQQPGTLSSLDEFGPVMYQNKPARASMFLAAPALAPEITGGSSIWGRTLGAPLLNTASRVGAGTAGNIAYDLPNIHNLEDLKKSSIHSLMGNALIEAGTLPYRVPTSLAETFNPLGHANLKYNQIRNDFSTAKAIQDATYKPVFDKYGSYNVTLDPVNYLNSTGIKRSKLYDQSKDLYDKFKNNPTFQNLHDLQSQIGVDLRQSQVAKSKPASVSRFRNYQNKLKDKVTNYLKYDDAMLERYKEGSAFTRDVVEPYRATPTLEKIAFGKKANVTPENLSSAITKGTEKIISRKGNQAFTAIPEGHALTNHLKDLEKIMNFGKLAKAVVPTATGILAGEALMPGMGGFAAGAGSGGGLAAGLLSTIGNPILGATLQNPFLKSAFKGTSVPYYMGARAAIPEFKNQ